MPKRSDAIEWLRFARDDLAAARLLLTEAGLPARIACFHAQQAGEKALKALLVSAEVQFRRTHDLAVLVALAPETAGHALRGVDLQLLQQWAVDARYPADLPEMTPSEAAEVLAVAERILEIVAHALERTNPN